MKSRTQRELSASWTHAAQALNFFALGFISGVRLLLEAVDDGLEKAHAFFHTKPDQRIQDTVEGRGYEDTGFYADLG